MQSANATNSAADRAALDAEVQQRLAEVDRIAQQTSFNGQKVLDGTFGNAIFQVGANVGETISIGLSTSMRSTAIGKTADYVNGSTAYSSASNIGQQGTGVNGTALGSGDVTIAVGAGQATTVQASAAAGGGAGQSISSAYAKAGRDQLVRYLGCDGAGRHHGAVHLGQREHLAGLHGHDQQHRCRHRLRRFGHGTDRHGLRAGGECKFVGHGRDRDVRQRHGPRDAQRTGRP